MRKTYPRAVALTVGTAMMLINGVVYAWSIYSVPFSEGFGWSSAQLGVCFTVMLGSFCLGGERERAKRGAVKKMRMARINRIKSLTVRICSVQEQVDSV